MLSVIRIDGSMAEIAHSIQIESFAPLLEQYQDYDTSPAMESVEQIRVKIDRETTTAYLFQLDGINVGWVRVTEIEDGILKISALCVLPAYQNRGIAQDAMRQIEARHPDAKKWTLATILQEEGNCHLYEKLGYVRVGDSLKINDKMTLVFYEKT